MIKVLPSSNPCPEEDLVDYVRSLEDLGVEYIHMDVMDGVFVENKCLNFDKIAEVRNNTNILLDVHLMVSNPLEWAQKLLCIKPNIVTIHLESVDTILEMEKIIRLLKSNDILFGLALKPETEINAIMPYLDRLDLVLVMSVEPGKSGQTYIDASTQKIVDAKKLIAGRDILLEVDGGINDGNYLNAVTAGAEFLVMGKAFFEAKNKKKLLEKIDEHYGF